MKAAVSLVERDIKNNITYLEDRSNMLGTMSITNDAENVVTWCREIYGNRVRIVYKDTEGEWWEIKWSLELDRGTVVNFERWHGIAWDILKR